MESLIAAQKKWERQNGLEKTIEDVQSVIDMLTKTRDDVASNAAEPALVLAKLKSPLKDSFERLNKDAKELYTQITNYGKLLDKRFKPMKAPQSSMNGPATTRLTNRAIGMHFLREGLFDVATTFVEEAVESSEDSVQEASKFWHVEPAETLHNGLTEDYRYHSEDEEMEQDDEHGTETGEDLQTKFADMYTILHALRNEQSLEPAIAWAKANSEALEARGSNLEFELCRLRFVELYYGRAYQDPSGRLRALEYARNTFPNFSHRYFKETASLVGSLAFGPRMDASPYAHLFYDTTAWEDVANSFTREFCGLLGLSERSPLYTAVTAGGIALPVLEKLERVMGEVGGQWTSANELPVEIPLPPSYLFHSIFVCPVSKEQATDSNPPMMMPCGHVIAKESLDKISRGSKRFKCPYCPNESHPRDAKKVYL
ncbi:hypothetical protein K461DRAFT_276463 [Myriangium duriaei CBS 260.36]|uniref:GID complex catalytic subunit 2 n=1 Tax=Myriangium duriaei CBS 260.36 TaxID=1168546 RepID=A0A9P4J8A5_9PEZI|nr:hypothetical protein K461DRAFT_276463 [Myriangium duriaei CBS 260.36]